VNVDLQGRTVIVTGGGGGIGGATAVQLAERGAAIVLVDRDETAAKDILGRLPQGSHHFIDADVGNPDDANGIFEWINSEGRDFAGLVNAAGIVSGGLPWPASDLHRMRAVIDVNAAGTVLLSTLAARQPVSNDRVIVNVASAAAIRAHPPDPAYATSKAGVLAFTRSAAAAAVPGLRVNAVLPGVVRTRMLDSTGVGGVAPWLAPRLEQRLLSAGQVAEAIVELVVGDQNGESWSLELDKSNPDVVVREVL
jgi:NAD(P)-dependent dehydrogenase (short-subunit alcohol dehydrogenase family)